MCILFGTLAGALFYSVAERNITHKRNGAMHFVRIGRVSLSYCVRKAEA